MIRDLKCAPEEENSELQHCLGDFILHTHHDQIGEETRVICRREFRGFINELGNQRQSALGFLQTSTTNERNFLIALAKGDLDSILDNPELLYKLENISPILYQTYCGLNPSEERLFQTLIGHIFEVYQDCFRPGTQWWEEEQGELEALDCEKYIVSGRKKIRLLPKYGTANGGDEKQCKKIPYNENNMCGTFFLCCCHGYFLVSLLMQVRCCCCYPIFIVI